MLGVPRGLAWVAQCVRHVLGPQQNGEDDARSTVVADWLAKRVGEGALTAGGPETRQEMRTSWRRVYEALPRQWLVYAPIESGRAVVELARAGLVGTGLLPIPFGSEVVATSHPDLDRLDRALQELGAQLENREGTSQNARDSRLVLAETLLSVRGDRPLGDNMTGLRLLRALQLPEGKDDAWSVSELRQRAAQHRVFARGAEEQATDPRQAVTELAAAVGNSFWLVPWAVPFTTEVPLVTNQALADAVSHAAAIAHESKQRVPLLKRLAEDDADTVVGRALRVLLTGVPGGGREECDLYYVRSEDTKQATNRRTLEILLHLRGQAWRAVEPNLAEPLRHDLFKRVGMKVVDPGVLQRLLQEILDTTAGAAWSDLQREGGAAPAEVSVRDRGRSRTVVCNATALGGRWRPRSARQPGVTRYRIRSAAPRTGSRDTTAGARCRSRRPVRLRAAPRPMRASSARCWRTERPHRFVGHIMAALRSNSDGGPIILPRDPTLRDRLKDRPWLPGRNGGAGVAPELLIDLPGGLQSLVDPLTGALGEFRLPQQVAPDLVGRRHGGSSRDPRPTKSCEAG